MSSPPILLIGSPRDPTFGHSVSSFRRQGLALEIIDLDRFCLSGTIEGRLDDPASFVVQDAGERVHLATFRSCYARFIDLPLDMTTDDSAPWGRYRLLQVAIGALDMLVVNRPGAGESNDSKPYQTALIQQHGFRIPRSCSTNLEAEAERFVSSCPRGAIYKSNSGERSIVQAVTPGDLHRLPLLTVCPVFFQERIWGDDIRVHVVRDRCHGVCIRSSEVDYRYDRTGTATERPFPVPPELADRCVRVTASFGLAFSGIDLIQAQDDGDFYCLEVNPMPGYHGYDLTLNHAISDSLGALLSSGSR